VETVWVFGFGLTTEKQVRSQKSAGGQKTTILTNSNRSPVGGKVSYTGYGEKMEGIKLVVKKTFVLRH